MALAFEQRQQTVNRIRDVGDCLQVCLFGHGDNGSTVGVKWAAQGQTQRAEGVFECEEQRSHALVHAPFVGRHLWDQGRDDGARHQRGDQDKRDDNQRMEHRIDFMRDVASQKCGFSMCAGRCCVMRIHIG